MSEIQRISSNFTKMYIPLVFFLVVSFDVHQCEAKEVKRRSVCGSTLKFIDCSDNINSYTVFSRRRRNVIKAKYVPGNDCEFKSIIMYWSIIWGNGTIFEKIGDETFAIEQYSIGYHPKPNQALLVIYEEYKDGKEAIVEANCLFEISKEDPIPRIKGGLEITTDSGKAIILDGRSSIDREVPPGHKGNLRYQWACTVSDPSISDICEGDPKEGPLTKIPAKYALDGLTYMFMLGVQSSESDWQSTSQIINVIKRAASIEIACVKNCPPEVLVTNVKEPTILEVSCTENCKQANFKLYKWTIDDENFSYESNTKFGRKASVFFIKKNVLTVDKVYQISVELADEEGKLRGKTTMELETQKPPSFEKCIVDPTSGEALKTVFIVHCTFKKGTYMFEVYSALNDIEILLERSTRLGNIEFVLSAGSKVVVKIIDEYELNGSKTVDVNVKESMNSVANSEQLEKELNLRYYDEHSHLSVNYLLKTKQYHRLIQTLSIFSDELEKFSKDTKFEETLKTHRNKILDVLKLIPLDSKERSKQIAGISKKIAEKTIDQQDPDMAVKATDLCKTAVEKALKVIKNEEYKQSFAEEIFENGKIFLDCAQIGASTNPDLLKPSLIVTERPTEFPLFNITAIEEDYPDYIDDEIISKVKTKFEQAGENLIDICFVNNQLQSIPHSPYDDNLYIQSERLHSLSVKKFGRDLPKSEISLSDFKIWPSEDFLVYKNIAIEVMMCVSQDSPFPSITGSVITSVVILQFQAAKQIIDMFSYPFRISFSNVNIDESNLRSYEGITPNDITNQTISATEAKFGTMTLYRIDVYRRQRYVIEFFDCDHALDVYVSEFYKPTYDEFKGNSREINSDQSKLIIENDKEYDRWDYMTVMPRDKNGQVTFKFKVYTFSCYSWQSSTRTWIFACESTRNSNLKYIECSCHHSSVLTGNIKNNAVIKQDTIYFDYSCEIQANYTIFTSVLIVWIVYCACLTYFSLVTPKEKKQEIYFLSDIPSFYRFGYLLIVKTSNKFNAGTTSNVVIKLYGKSADSKEHVLNFPDPDKRILQKNQEDWFFLATEYYLGDIEKIDIWFDSVGARPSWYCSEIEVIDLQLQKYWWFVINFKFEIRYLENHVFTAVPIDKLSISRKIAMCLEGSHMWNIFDSGISIDKVKRLTIMMSVFLTTFIIILLYYGMPLLKRCDALKKYIYYDLYPDVFWAAIIGSVGTFLIHYPVVYLFRFSNLKTNPIDGSKIPKLSIYEFDTILWCLLVFLILFAMTVLMIFGMWMPRITSLLWLTSSVGSLIVYILLLENISRIINNLVSRNNSRIKQIFDKRSLVLQNIEAQRIAFYSMLGRLSMRPYFKRAYKVLNRESIKRLKKWAKEEQKFLEILEDLVMVGLYVILLYVIIVRDRDPMTCYSNAEMRDLTRGKQSKTDFEYFLSRKEIDRYIEESLIPSLQSLLWYGRYIKKDPGMVIDNTNKYIGIARLRQHRSDDINCQVVPIMNFARNICTAEFYTGPDYRNFSERWMNVAESDRFARMDPVWKYQGLLGTERLSYIGDFATYSGGGFIATLGRTFINSMINAKYLLRNNWLDEKTRCLFIEFLTYSANSNLFNSVTVILEIDPVGYVLSKYKVNTARLLVIKEHNNITTWLTFLIFVIIVILFTFKLINRIRIKKKMAFTDIWYGIDILILFMTLICFLLYTKRSQAVKSFLRQLEQAKHNEFISYFYLFYSELVLIYLAAFLVFVATFRLWKLLRFLIIIRVVEKTLVFSAIYLFSMFILHFHMLIAFSVAGFLLFGDQSYEFKDFPRSLMSLTLASLGFFSFDLQVFTSPQHYIYYCLFMLFNLVVINLYIVLITINYAEAQLIHSNLEEYNVFSYIKDQYHYYKELVKVKLKKYRLKGGQDMKVDEIKPVYPKADEHRYAKCLTVKTNKMNAMRQIVLSYARNMRRNVELTDEDAELMKRTVVSLTRENANFDEKEYFFLSNLEGYGAALVDDLKFLKMEEILNKIFAKTQEVEKSDAFKKVIENNTVLFDRIFKSLGIVTQGLNCIDFGE